MAKQLRLETLKLQNFKGVRNFVLDARGEDVRVYGDNATGKTTLFDGMLWLLFDKDSNNKKDFALKTLDADGNELHMLEHEVEGTFSLDGKQLVLRKVFSEKWTKKRGSAKAEHTGHSTDYFVDGVPVKKNEYTKQIEAIVQEDVFKLLTSPSYFNDSLKWQDRRKTLLEICGDISDEDVIASDASLAKLPVILQGRSLENHRKVIAARRAEINKELEKIPVRIDEIRRGLPQLEGLDKPALEAEISELNAQIDGNMAQISNIRNGKAIVEKQKAVQEVEMQLLQIRRDHDAAGKDEAYRLKARIQEEQGNISILNGKLNTLATQERYNHERVSQIEIQLVQLRQEWHETNSQQFEHTDACECPTCGQSLPQEQVEETRSKALAQFNLKKGQRLESIQAKGKQGNERKQVIVQENEKLAVDAAKLVAQIAEKEAQLVKLQEQLKMQEGSIGDILDNPQYVSKLQEKKQLEDDIRNVRDMAEQAVAGLEMEILSLRQQRGELEAKLATFTLAAQYEQRIEELCRQERDLAAEFEQLEHELFLTEEFIRTKVNMLEERINSRFKYARFKLFEQQINGGLTEVCETLYNGVPYGSGLNNAAKINVGLDIINTLAEHYGFAAPIFIDNREAVTRLIETQAQTISLIVSEADKVLRVEKQPTEHMEVVS